MIVNLLNLCYIWNSIVGIFGIVNLKLDILHISGIYFLVFINKTQFSSIFSVYICMQAKSSRFPPAAFMSMFSIALLIVDWLTGHGSVGKMIRSSGQDHARGRNIGMGIRLKVC